MKAIILAAGRGNRLLNYTNETPKCLIEVQGQAILDYQLQALDSCGVKDIGIVVGYQADKIIENYGDRVEIFENKDYLETNSSYSLWLAKDFIKDGFIYLNSDLLFATDILQSLLDDESENAIMVSRKVDMTDDMFKANMEGDVIVEMEKQMGVALVSASVIGPAKFGVNGAAKVIDRLNNLIEQQDHSQWCYKIFNDIAADIALKGIDVRDKLWFEVDTPEDLELAQKEWKYVSKV